VAVWKLEPVRQNLHGHFSRDLAPVLTIQSGDTVIYQTLDAAWNRRPRRFEGDVADKFQPVQAGLDNGHCLVGPVAIADAHPGMTLEIRIDEIRTGTLGWTSSAGWSHEVHKRLGISDPPEVTHFWSLDPDLLLGRNQFGHEIDLHPFMGVMGMPPCEVGIHPTAPPRPTGGNLDCKELVKGTNLFLPISVPGALFSVGDGHAAQGDGEVCVTAIECPMDHVELTFFLHPDMKIVNPRIKTPTAWITLGTHEDLDEATFIALEEMLMVMGELYGLDRRNALALASNVVDMRITQIVNGVKGAHAILPHNAIRT
jgi:acetamidase/formamidase